MGEIFKLFGSIGLNTKEADDGIDKTTNNAEKQSSKIGEFFKKAAITIGAAFAVDKLIDFGKTAVEAAASAQAIQAQFQQVFGEAGNAASDSIEKMASEFGMLPNRLQKPLTDATSRFKGLGMSTEAAMTLAETSVRAAADAAAFYDTSYEDANASLASFTKGNYEGGESIGIFANDTQMAAYAIRKGVVDTTANWQQLDEATKQATRLDYAKNMQEQAGAAGQAARESGGYENQMGNLKQSWQDFLVVVGGPILQPLISGMQTLSGWLTDGATKLKDFQAWMNENKTTVDLIGIAFGTLAFAIGVYTIAENAATIAKLAGAAAHGIATVSAVAYGAAVSFLTSPITLVILAIGAMIAIGVLLYKNWDTVSEKLGQFGSFVSTKFEGIKNAIVSPIQKAMDFFGGAIDFIRGLFNFTFSWPKIPMPHFGINPSGWQIGDLLKGKIPSLGIDWYAKGGIFTSPTIFGSNGISLQGAGDAGPEAALPLNARNLGMIGAGIAEVSDQADRTLLRKIVDRLDTLVEVVRLLIEADPKYQVLLDSGVLVGELTPLVDRALAKINADKERGRKG